MWKLSGSNGSSCARTHSLTRARRRCTNTNALIKACYVFSVCSVYEIKDGGMCRKEEGGEEESDMEVGGIWAEMEISRLFSFFSLHAP